MQAVANTTNEYTQNISFTFEATEVTSLFTAELRRLQKRMSIPGFRKGKTPLKVVQQRYGRDVSMTLQERFVKQAWQHMIQNLEIVPMSSPDVNINTSVLYNKEFQFEVEVEVVPEFEFPQSDSFELEMTEWEASEERVDAELTQMKAQAGEWLELTEREDAQVKDQVTFSLRGESEGEEIEELAATEEKVELGSRQLIPSIEEGLVGLKVGEKFNVDYSFPEDHTSEKLAGLTVTFSGEVTAIDERTPVSIEELLTKMEIEDEETLRQQIKENLESSYTQKTRNELREKITKMIREQLDFTVPPTALEEQVHRRLHNAHEHGEGEACAHDHSDEEAEEARSQAAKDIRFDTFLHRYAKQNEVIVSDEEVTQHILGLLQTSGRFGMQLLQMYRDPEARSRLKQSLVEDKVLDIMIEGSTLNKTTVPVPSVEEASEQ